MRRLIFAIAPLLALPAFGQQPLVETIEVRVANIDVVVRDKHGNPVTGLTKDDFILTDDKVPQTITNFYEVRRGEDVGDNTAKTAESEVPVELRQRRVVLFVDAMSLTPARRHAVLDSVQKYIDTKMRPEDMMMLVVWRYGNHVITPFTNDRATLKKGLDTLARFGPAGEATGAVSANLRRDIEQLVKRAEDEQSEIRVSTFRPLYSWDDAYRDARRIVSRYGERLLVEQQALLDGAWHVTDSMAGLDGKKVLVMIGEQFPEHPGAELYRYIDNVFGPHMDLRNQLDTEGLNGVTGNSLPAEIEQFAKGAAANGVTVYSIAAQSSDADIASDNIANNDFQYTFARDANTASALQLVAAVTGGVAITRTSNFELAFDTITRDLSSYYSLGYRPKGEGMRQHNIVVKTKDPSYRVRSRSTFVAKSTDDQMSDRVIANLYVDPTHNDWPIAIRTGPLKAEKGTFIVPVNIEIPSSVVTLLPDTNDTLAGNLTLYFVVANGDGATSTVLRRPEPINIPKDRETLARAKPMIFHTALRVKPGESTLSVAIIDQLTGTQGFARTKIAAK